MATNYDESKGGVVARYPHENISSVPSAERNNQYDLESGEKGRKHNLDIDERDLDLQGAISSEEGSAEKLGGSRRGFQTKYHPFIYLSIVLVMTG